VRRSFSEALASGKLVVGDSSSEGSQTAKSGTDEQERHMRLLNVDKQAHHCDVQRIPKAFYSRCLRNRRKEKALTGGGLTVHELAMVRSQQKP
jgi:hypothetical protein